MRRIPLLTFAFFLLAASATWAQKTATPTTKEGPLTALPYTPSLDTSVMDKSVNPCTDFYKYSCGLWNKKNPIPADQARWNVYAKMGDDNRRFLWGILQEAAKPNPQRKPIEREIGDYFNACMDETAIEKAGSAPIKPELDRINALKSTADLPELLADLHLGLGGGNMFFGFGANQDFANSSSEIGFAGAGGLGLPDRDYYTKTDAKSVEIRQKYVEHVARMLQLLGDAPDRAQAEAKMIMDIETAFAKASLTRVEKRDPYKTFHDMTQAQLQALTDSFNWSVYLRKMGVPKAATINVTEPEFFKELQKQFAGRKIDDWKPYLRWGMVRDAAPYLSSNFAQENFNFYSKYLNGVEQMRPRWKRCVGYVDEQLGEALGQVFVDKTFTPDMKARTVAMTKQIELAMQSEIEKLPWMSGPTKQKAEEKLHAIVNKVGYPNRWRDYSSIKLDRQDFLGNVTRAGMFETKRQLAKIGKPVDRGEWQMTPPTINAYYDPQMNDINFPAGVLQPPLYDAKLDDAPNYGNTGATIGHELTHGFDDEGRQFDSKGNLHDWWTKKDAQEFQQRVDCVVKQYSGYTAVDDIKVNGQLTLGENVADIGGTLLAYIAWKNATKDQQLHPIDGFTPDQRFFIGMAQWACGDARKESRRSAAMVDPHSPDEFRINGVVADLPEFQQAFSCKVGQPMVSKDACRVW